MLRGEAHHFCDFVSRRISLHMRVAEKKYTLPRNHEADRGERIRIGGEPDDVADVTEFRAEAPLEPAQHGVSLAASYRKRRNDGRRGAYQRPRCIGGDAAPP